MSFRDLIRRRTWNCSTRLAKDFVKNGYRMKPLIRGILNSATYQLASVGAPVANAFGSSHGADPDRYFTKAALRMLSAEQILDAISAATGVPETFRGYPLGTRAVELAEGGVNHPFLQAFSKPVRDVSCECAREEDPSLPQMLHLLNNKGIAEQESAHRQRGWRRRWPRGKTMQPWWNKSIWRRCRGGRRLVKSTIAALRHIDNVGDRGPGLQDLRYAIFNLGLSCWRW